MMRSFHKHSLTLFYHLVFVFVLITISQQAEAKEKALNHSVSAIFIFGDSTVDPGNNNYILTPFKSDFLPYGRDFVNQNPTGRFTNGRLSNDFMATYLGIKEYVPPYLDPTLSIEELMTGVSFASAGSGFDPLTPKLSNVIPVSKQIEYFKEYQERLEVAIGKRKTKDLIKNAVYFVSAGTNDFVVNYFLVPIRRKSYDLPTYMDFLLQQVQLLLQGLWKQGARRMAVVGLPPMGCLPIVITLFSDSAIMHRACVDFYSSVARAFNVKFENMLNAMQSSLANLGSRIVYIDAYGPLSEMIQGHTYEFDEVIRGCCGTGIMETALLCNPKSPVCSDASKYVFFDSIHPTEKAYYILFLHARPKVDSIVQD
ncbi:hypothetical protein F0562_013975 [Nyssa sinensis]|uniref:Uncharacterized protein n=1 Tax=Nyssa sinensis TaxID=561372 RepID=A0A5J4ZP17_9ASTE|nr:hypothetical protein F0562_013975 [Nyssa sinensis]